MPRSTCWRRSSPTATCATGSSCSGRRRRRWAISTRTRRNCSSGPQWRPPWRTGTSTTTRNACCAPPLATLESQAGDIGFITAAIRKPLPLEVLLRDVRDPHLASLVYAASLLAIDKHGDINRAYLHYLATRLRLPQAVLERLHSQYGYAPRRADLTPRPAAGGSRPSGGVRDGAPPAPRARREASPTTAAYPRGAGRPIEAEPGRLNAGWRRGRPPPKGRPASRCRRAIPARSRRSCAGCGA